MPVIVNLTAYPTGADLMAFLYAAGILTGSLNAAQKVMDYDAAVADAVAELEERTGYTPFLSTATQDTTYWFDLDGTGLINFASGGGPGGLVSFTSLSVGGSLYTQNQQYRLQPVNAPSRGRPYTYIELIGRLYYGYRFTQTDGPGLVAVVGKGGYCTSLRRDVSEAIVARAAARVAPRLALLVNKGMMQQMEGDVQVTWSRGAGMGVYVTEAAAWSAQFERVVRDLKSYSVT